MQSSPANSGIVISCIFDQQLNKMMKFIHCAVHEINRWAHGAVQCEAVMLDACSMHVQVLYQQGDWPFVHVIVPPLLSMLSTYGGCRNQGKH